MSKKSEYVWWDSWNPAPHAIKTALRRLGLHVYVDPDNPRAWVISHEKLERKELRRICRDA